MSPSLKETVMTDIDNLNLPPEPPLRQPEPEDEPVRSSAWRRTFAFVGVLVGGVALGAGGFAVAAAGADNLGWKQGARLALVQGAVSHALDSVGANAAQEAKVHDIIAIKFAEIAPDPAQHEAMRKQALELLAAPTIDRAAIEKMRADAIANLDAKSKTLVGGLLDIADQLTPQQRTALTAEIGEMAQHGAMMGPWGGWRHGHPMIDDGPNGPPDSAPDKD
jgi:periplasmic protein CpxP/Spy